MRSLAILTAAVLVSLAMTDSAAAQRGVEQPAAEEGEGRESWFERSGYHDGPYEPPTPLAIIQQKAQQRARARIRRIETLAAYGMSNARPTANPAPMTGMYSPAWQMQGGRPYAWFTTARPQYIIWR